MSTSYTSTQAYTFTITHARYLASKVATDLKRIQRFYGSPSDLKIVEYESEITEMLKNGYLAKVTYGFKKDNNWIEPTLSYTAYDLNGATGTDDDPGRIKPNANVVGATFGSFLEYTSKWDSLSSEEKDKFQKTLPIQRSSALEPGVSGYLSSDKSYSSGGKSLNRSSVKSY